MCESRLMGYYLSTKPMPSQTSTNSTPIHRVVIPHKHAVKNRMLPAYYVKQIPVFNDVISAIYVAIINTFNVVMLFYFQCGHAFLLSMWSCFFNTQ
jgi:hypothetical protein